MFAKSIFCIVATLAPSILTGFSSFLEETRNKVNHNILDEFELSQIRPWTAELTALECLKNHFFSVVTTPAPSILIRKKKLCPVTVLVDSRLSIVALGLFV